MKSVATLALKMFLATTAVCALSAATPCVAAPLSDQELFATYQPKVRELLNSYLDRFHNELKLRSEPVIQQSARELMAILDLDLLKNFIHQPERLDALYGRDGAEVTKVVNDQIFALGTAQSLTKETIARAAAEADKDRARLLESGFREAVIKYGRFFDSGNATAPLERREDPLSNYPNTATKALSASDPEFRRNNERFQDVYIKWSKDQLPPVKGTVTTAGFTLGSSLADAYAHFGTVCEKRAPVKIDPERAVYTLAEREVSCAAESVSINGIDFRPTLYGTRSNTDPVYSVVLRPATSEKLSANFVGLLTDKYGAPSDYLDPPTAARWSCFKSFQVCTNGSVIVYRSAEDATHFREALFRSFTRSMARSETKRGLSFGKEGF